ncbi:DUF1697 domain-containing protein [Pararhizobium sp.]|uniref:DUF1697 domain-containing protein n=1 Tax=Pararhizobium sp. TaxID=1977563 RepID=UPI00271C6D49|nr:DUF1697 domain-containing protein [Pararhizobium sp.]MDO9417075.1 DUF1697 domain-containing protein [Pararhizobium sp.]
MLYVALLHSIVLGPGKRLVMADLKAVAENLGYRNVRTLVATGNLVFEADTAPAAQLEHDLEQEFAAKLGKHVDIIVRTGPAWLKLAKANPFADGQGSEVCVRVMRTKLDDSVITKLEPYRTGEKIAVVGGDLWIDFCGKASETRLLSHLTVKKLGPGTIRNANTVNGMSAMLEGGPGGGPAAKRPSKQAPKQTPKQT